MQTNNQNDDPDRGQGPYCYKIVSILNPLASTEWLGELQCDTFLLFIWESFFCWNIKLILPHNT